MGQPEKITSRQNSLLVQTVRLQSSKKFRQTQCMFAGDGTKLLEEAVRWAPELLYAVILQEGVACPAVPDHVRVVEISRSLMEQVSAMEAPEGAIFLCRMPETKNPVLRPGTLVLDGIQDPGNVGTILRTADAFDVPVVLTEGCADPYNPKTVRATMGAVFRTPPVFICHDELIAQCAEKNIPLLATALSDASVDIRSAALKNAAVVIGSEGKGVSRRLLDASYGQLIIPMTSRCESLNAAVAAAVTLWQMTAL